MNLKNGDEAASFFKIIKDNSLDYLPLPAKAAQEYMEKGNNSAKKQTLVLDPNSGVKWSVKYLKIDDKHYFLDGWHKFVKENHIQNHDLVVFWLLPDDDSPDKSTFLVLLYGPDGSLKHPPTINIISSSPPNDSPSKLPTTGRRRPSVVEKSVIAEPDVMRDRKKRCLNEKSSHDDDDDDEDDDNDSLQKAHKSIIIRKSYRSQLQMTKGYWKANGLDAYDCVWLKTDEGKMWKVGVNKYSNCPRLTKGWRDFRMANKINIGSILEITHVKENMLQVRVIKESSRGKDQTEEKG